MLLGVGVSLCHMNVAAMGVYHCVSTCTHVRRNEKHDIPLLVETCVHEVERRGETGPPDISVRTLSC